MPKGLLVAAGCVVTRAARYANDVLACTAVSDLIMPFIAFAVKCFKAGVFNDNLISVSEKALNRTSTIYLRHALNAKVAG